MTNTVERAVWWVVAVAAIASVLLAGLMAWAVADSLHVDTLFGNVDWNPGSLTTAPPPPPGPPVPELLPPGAPVPAPTPPG